MDVFQLKIVTAKTLNSSQLRQSPLLTWKNIESNSCGHQGSDRKVQPPRTRLIQTSTVTGLNTSEAAASLQEAAARLNAQVKQ